MGADNIRAVYPEQRFAGVDVLAEVPYFLKKERLVVVGYRREGEITTAERALPPRLRR